MESIDPRKSQLEQWLTKVIGLDYQLIQPMQKDASFRRYFRIISPTMFSSTAVIAMDAPLPEENCDAFVAIAHTLRNMGLIVPEIFAADMDAGFLLLSDLGNLTYRRALNKDNADQLYPRALKALSILQSCEHVPQHSLGVFDYDFMWREWSLHKEWFLNQLLNISFTPQEKHLDQCVRLLLDAAVAQPQVFMHRDYHSANLMVLPDQQVGILDFQDALIGPITYDVVSLLRDCYVDWPQQQVMHWLQLYWEMLRQQKRIQAVSEDCFVRWFDWMGIQRHLKALFIFARKYKRDQDNRYLPDIPRTLNYVITVSQAYPELTALTDYMGGLVKAVWQEKMLCAG